MKSTISVQDAFAVNLPHMMRPKSVPHASIGTRSCRLHRLPISGTTVSPGRFESMPQWDRAVLQGLTLSCRKVGAASHPCLLLLHGWPQTSLAWRAVLDALGEDQYVLAFDLPG